MTLIRWEDHPAQVMEGITELYKISEFTDCVLDVEEGSIHGHKIILAACSPYLKKLLMDHQGMTMIPFKEVKYKDMKLILDFMYLGEVDVPLVDVASLMDTAELLQISSLRCATHHFAEESATADVCTNEKRAIPNKDLHSGRKDRFDSIGRNIEVISVKGSKRKAIYVLKQLPEKANEDQPNVSVFETDVIGSDHVNNIRDESLSITFVAVPSEPEERGEEEQNKGGEVCVHSADQSVSYDARDGTVPDGADGLEVQYKSISVISVPDLEAGNWIDTSVVVEDTKVSRESSSLGGEGEISNCESQETYLIHYEPAATEGLGDDANVSHLEPKEAIVLLETADPDGHQMEVSHDTVTGHRQPEEKEVKKRFPCIHCEKSFPTADRLKSHKRYHSGTKPHLCGVCGASFVEKSNLKRHARRHTGERPYSCDVCGASYSEGGALKKHSRTHTGEKPYACGICGESYRLKSSLKYHVTKHTGEKSYPCCICKESFGDIDCRKAHMKTIHPDEYPFACSACDATYLHKAMLKKHVATHSGVRAAFSCDACDASFFRKDLLKNHRAAKHSTAGAKPFLCSVCGASFAERSNLKRHERSHVGDRSFLCSFCAASFVESGDLKRHLRIHTGEKKFPCRFCRVSFGDYSSRTAHVKTEHSEFLFACSVCDASFVEKSSLKSHRKKHDREFSCVLCEASFACKSDLKCHVATHTGEKTHACGACGARFVQRGNLRRHQRIHTGEKPFSCDICGAAFAERGTLKRHVKTHIAETKTHSCVICEASFRFRLQLKKHVEESHAV